ncbi:FxSxx-COOH system tetratricopeptide repeat protein [Streptomyces olivochromogenes]|uniref:FxSxx-COOH system tetratricopeptide repeat protein n=1 Tax=Streptomyces olivochromogenes TaxID=1963 RepID=UPI0036DC62F9
MAVGDGNRSCFISYARDDQAWAEWAAWQLQDAGYEVWLDVWSLTPGADWRAEASAAVRTSQQVLVLVSSSYAHSANAATELAAALAGRARVIPVLLDDGPFPAGLDDLRDLPYLRLAGRDDTAAREALLRAVAPERPPTGGRLRRFGATSPRLPGSRPRVWRVPPRSDRFVGRVELLKELRGALTENSRAVLVGVGGAGKTQLAIEYAHRFAGEYELVWWIGHGGGKPALLQLAELATHIGAAESDAPIGQRVKDLVAELRTRSRWLLVFDDVPEAEDTRLPERVLRDTGTGQILLISRDQSQAGFGDPIEVGPFTPEESLALLRSLAPELSAQDARGVAAGGDIPLTVGMAAEAINSGVSVDVYREALSTEPATSPPHSLAHTVRIGLAQLSERNPGAVALLSACSLLAPEPFRLRDCVHVPDWAPEPLATVLRDGRVRRAALGAAGSFSLAHTADDTVRIHPAVHSALRDEMSATGRADAALGAQALLVSALPALRATSETRASLLPHLLAVAARDLTRVEGLKAACEGCVRLLEDGGAPAAASRLTELREASAALLGASDPTTMEIQSYLVDALQAAGEPEAARPLAETLLDWLRYTFGGEEQVTLHAAAQLATLLTESEHWAAALDIGEKTRKQLRSVLGADHPAHLTLASTLLTPLRALGRAEEGRRLGQDTLARQRRSLSPDAPDALRTSARLAVLLVDLGKLDRACSLGEETHHLLRLSKGPGDVTTLRAAVLLAVLKIRVNLKTQALSLLEKTLDQQRQVLGADHIDALRTSALLAVLRADSTAPDPAVLARYAREADLPSEVRLRWERSISDTRPEFIAEHLFTEVLRTGADILKTDRLTKPPRPSESRRRPASFADRGSVLVSHVEADRSWANWVTFELDRLGYETTTLSKDTHLGRRPLREYDIVLALLSPDYLASVVSTPRDTAEWIGLPDGDGHDPRRFIPLLVKPVDSGQLPRALRDPAAPALYDLDPDAARDVLQFALEEPARPNGAPAFPGASSPSDSDEALLTHRLVNALQRSAALQRRDSRNILWDLLGLTDRETVSPRTALFELVRSLRSRPDGLSILVEALDLVEPDSLANAEVRNIVAEFQRGQAAR